MNIVVTFQDRRPDEQLAYVARRAIGQALQRFAARIRDITVAIRGADEGDGAEAPECCLALQVAGGRELHLRSSDATAEGALRGIAARAARAVGDALARVRPARPAALERPARRAYKRRRDA